VHQAETYGGVDDGFGLVIETKEYRQDYAAPGDFFEDRDNREQPAS